MSDEDSFISSKSKKDDDPNKKKPKALTALEQQYFDQAMEKHKTNMIKTQVVSGKVFKGNGFISKPEKIVFKVEFFSLKIGFRCWGTNDSDHSYNQFILFFQFFQDDTFTRID